MGVAFVTGLQGDDPHYYRAISAPKHMVTEAGKPIVAEGKYTIIVGGGQPNTEAQVLTRTFRVKGRLMLPE